MMFEVVDDPELEAEPGRIISLEEQAQEVQRKQEEKKARKLARRAAEEQQAG